MKLIDIGANLTDPMFRGIYCDKRKHDDDFNDILKRATAVGVEKIIIIDGSLSNLENAIDLCKYNDNLYCTVLAVIQHVVMNFLKILISIMMDYKNCLKKKTKRLWQLVNAV